MRLLYARSACAMALIFIVSSASSSAASSPDAAAGYVQNWLKQSGQVTRFDGVSFQAIDDSSGLYIVHCQPRGFVIASGCKDRFSIIGYSFENNFDESKPNPVTQKLLSASVASLQENPLAKMSATDTVPPLTTALFAQTNGWNALCPSDDSAANGKTALGCTAVSLAIIMHYWKYPFRGQGTLTYAHPKYGALSADLHSTRYEWNKMSSTAPDSHNTTLLYHVALALKTEFGPRASGVSFAENTLYAMKKYFGYDLSLQYFAKDHFAESEWITMLKGQLKQGFPIIYRGSTTDGTGHQFVIDGYNSDDFFHLNWGWGGNGNGYYQINNFTYQANNYKKSQMAILSVKPSKLLPPRNLKGKRQANAIELSWKPPQEDVMLVYFELNHPSHVFNSYGFPRRITRFSASSFGLAPPLTITGVGHSFYSITPDSFFTFAVYDTDMTTELGKSSELKADGSYMDHRFTAPFQVSDSFAVGVIPSNPMGNLNSFLSEVDPAASRSMYGQPGSWHSFVHNQMGGELHTYVYARGTYLPGKFPEGGFFIERNGSIIDTLHSLETCTYRDSTVSLTSLRYRVIAFRDTTAYVSPSSDSIVVSLTPTQHSPSIVFPDAFYLKGNKCVVQTGFDALISLEIFNIAGKKIQTLHIGLCKSGINRFTIMENKISGGYYIMRFLIGNRAMSAPFVVQ